MGLGALKPDDPGQRELYRRAQQVVESGIKERTKRLGQIAGYMEASMPLLAEKAQRELADQRAFSEKWPEVEAALGEYRGLSGEAEEMERVLAGMEGASGSYVEIVQGLEEEVHRAGTRWLQGIVDSCVGVMDWA